VNEFNFEIDQDKNLIKIAVNPEIYSFGTIMKTAYQFIEDFWVAVDGGYKEAIVKLKPREDCDLEEVGYRFNQELIFSYLKEMDSKRYSEVRNAMIAAALAPKMRRGKSGEQVC